MKALIIIFIILIASSCKPEPTTIKSSDIKDGAVIANDTTLGIGIIFNQETEQITELFYRNQSFLPKETIYLKDLKWGPGRNRTYVPQPQIPGDMSVDAGPYTPTKRDSVDWGLKLEKDVEVSQDITDLRPCCPKNPRLYLNTWGWYKGCIVYNASVAELDEYQKGLVGDVFVYDNHWWVLKLTDSTKHAQKKLAEKFLLDYQNKKRK